MAPAGPLNVGSVARVMKNFGLSQLYLVDPQCDYLGAEALQMAVHADDLLQAAQKVQTIPEALVGCEYAIATTARTRGFDAQLDLPEIALPNLLNSSNQSDTALIFGPEDRGLSNEELTYAQQFLKISTTDTYSALNLAQAVTICCYELSRASSSLLPSPISYPPQENKTLPLQNTPSSAKQSESVSSSLIEGPVEEPVERPSQRQPKAKLEDLEGYYNHLESLLLQVGYLHPHTTDSRMRKLRQLLHKASPTAPEVALLRGMLRQTEWALSQSNQHTNNGKSEG